ncbi:MAG: AAA family ATPase [Polyangiaceae bacterium]|nr:AAA family ATPase [Polyangiaceae bacterium]
MRIAYGEADFAKIRRGGFFYVDKTPFLHELERADLGYSKLVFLRPRRFGKSSLVSMMEHYYDVALGAHFDELFRGLWVHEHPTPEKSKYFVLHLNFSLVASSPDENVVREHFLRAVKSALVSMYARYRGRIPMLDRFFENEVHTYNDPGALISNVFGIMAGTGNPMYVMIDEYDTFATALLSSDRSVYSNVIDKSGFVRTFYHALKAGTETGAVARVFITGGTPILLDDLMTGFNVATNISTHPNFNALAGFTRADVERALDELLASRPALTTIDGIEDRSTLMAVLDEHYDGYRFCEDAEESIFNSNLVLYFLRELSVRGRYPRRLLDPNARTDYKKLHSLWASVGPAAQERREAIETVLNEGAIWSELVEQFGSRHSFTRSEFVSLMYYTGMLTLAQEEPMGPLIRFEVPNRVIRELNWQHFTHLLEDLDRVTLHSHAMSMSLLEMTSQGNIEPFLEELRKNVLAVLSNKDLKKHDEKAMKMLLIGTIVTANFFYVFSEQEFAQGFNDLFLTPLPSIPKAKYAWMIELKYLTTKERRKVGSVVAQAETQLRKYMADDRLVTTLTQGKELRAGTLVFVGGKDVTWHPFAT